MLCCVAIACVSLPGCTTASQNVETLNELQPEPIRVVVWDEQQPKQKKAYPEFLGNQIAAHLKKSKDLKVTSVRFADPEQGLSAEILDACDVLVYWEHTVKAKISVKKAKDIVRRIKEGKLDLVALHSAHWAMVFMEAMNERTRTNMERKFAGRPGEKVEFQFVRPKGYRAPKKDTPLTPSAEPRKFPDGRTKVTVQLPNCCFPGYRADGKPSTILTLKPDHPIAKGIPATFVLPHTEMYDEPFHVPDPDEVVFEERWATGEWFRAGMVWNIGKGKVFYFRPGHETYKVFFEEKPLKILENAVRWLGTTGP